MLATATIVVVPALIFLCGIYATVLITKYFTKTAASGLKIPSQSHVVEPSDLAGSVTREGRAILDSPADYGTDARQFRLRFGGRDSQSAYFYKAGTNLAWIASIRGVKPGSIVDLTSLHTRSDYRELAVGELFLTQNAAGYVMQGRIVDVRTRETDDSGEGMVIFNYRIEPQKASITIAV